MKRQQAARDVHLNGQRWRQALAVMRRRRNSAAPSAIGIHPLEAELEDYFNGPRACLALAEFVAGPNRWRDPLARVEDRVQVGGSCRG